LPITYFHFQVMGVPCGRVIIAYCYGSSWCN